MTLKTMTATILAASLSTAAFAGSSSTDASGGVGVGIKADTGVEANVGGTNVAANENGMSANVGANADAGANAGANFGSLISELQNGSNMPEEWSVDIAALEEGAQVEIVTLSELKGQGAENSAALDQALKKDEEAAASARTAIQANAELTAALEAENFTADDVVAVKADGTSHVTLIVDDAA